MLRSELKVGDVFRYTNSGVIPHKWYLVTDPLLTDRQALNAAIEADCSDFSNSRTMSDKAEVVLRGVKEEPNLAEALQPHWRGLNPEPVSVIEAWGYDKNWYRANAIKYLSRAGKKAGVSTRDDLLKALSFIIREITALDGAPSWNLDKEGAGAKAK